jgi:hypothetical protein
MPTDWPTVRILEGNALSEPEKLFEIGHLERIVSGGLISCIKAHGPVTRNFVGSATKRIAQNLRGQLKQFAGAAHNRSASLAKYKQDLAYENERIVAQNISLKRQRDDLLEKLRKGETIP